MLPTFSVRSGIPAFSSAGEDPNVKLAWNRNGPAGFSVGGNVNWSGISRLTAHGPDWMLGGGFVRRRPMWMHFR